MDYGFDFHDTAFMVLDFRMYLFNLSVMEINVGSDVLMKVKAMHAVLRIVNDDFTDFPGQPVYLIDQADHKKQGNGSGNDTHYVAQFTD